MNIEKPSENINVYVDQRQQLFGNNEEDETMENWDDEKLKEVV